MSHAYANRYAVTDCGPVHILTREPITTRKAKAIIEATLVSLGSEERYLSFVKWVPNWSHLMGWRILTIYDEAQT